jgi:uncharacterized protein (DUF2141 family)
MNVFRAAIACAASIFGLGPGLAHAAQCQGAPTGTKLAFAIDSVDSSRGLMTGSLYPGDRSQFLVKNGALKVWSVPAVAPQTRMCIWVRGPGTYAFAVYHDANSNGRWDHRLLGHIEGVGFSNNPRVVFSAPSYDQVKFEAGAGETTLHLRMHYP